MYSSRARLGKCRRFSSGDGNDRSCRPSRHPQRRRSYSVPQEHSLESRRVQTPSQCFVAIEVERESTPPSKGCYSAGSITIAQVELHLHVSPTYVQFPALWLHYRLPGISLPSFGFEQSRGRMDGLVVGIFHRAECQRVCDIRERLAIWPDGARTSATTTSWRLGYSTATVSGGSILGSLDVIGGSGKGRSRASQQ